MKAVFRINGVSINQLTCTETKGVSINQPTCTKTKVPGAVPSPSDKSLTLSPQQCKEHLSHNRNVRFGKIRLKEIEWLSKVTELGPTVRRSHPKLSWSWIDGFSPSLRIIRYIHGMCTYVLNVSKVRKVKKKNCNQLFLGDKGVQSFKNYSKFSFSKR